MLTTRQLARACGVTTVDIRNAIRRFPDKVKPIQRTGQGKTMLFDESMVAVVLELCAGMRKYGTRRPLNTVGAE